MKNIGIVSKQYKTKVALVDNLEWDDVVKVVRRNGTLYCRVPVEDSRMNIYASLPVEDLTFVG